MKTILRSALLVLGMALLGASIPAIAITLGKARGGVILGQPLAISFAVQSDVEEEVAEGCFTVDIYYGDLRLTDGVRVGAAQHTGSTPLSVNVTAATPVSEPIVAVQLNSICGAKNSRKYVFLSDIASEIEQPVLVSTANPGSKTAAKTALSPVIAPKAASIDASASNAPPQGAQQASVIGAVAKVPGRAEKRIRMKPQQMATGKDGNQLLLSAAKGPLPKPEEHVPAAEVVGGAVDDLKKRVEALDAWQAANSNAQIVLKDSSRLRSLESDINGLKTLANRNQQVLTSANDRLDKIESQRFSGVAVYGLMFALAISIAGFGAIWLRSRQQPNSNSAPWWSSEVQQKSTTAVADEGVVPVVDSTSEIVTPDTATSTRKVTANEVQSTDRDAQLDIDLNVGESIFSKIDATSVKSVNPGVAAIQRMSDAPPAGRREFANSGLGTLRSVNTKEMLDVRQQAEFFMTLGQHDEAIKILEGSISNSHESNPLVYLDLIKVFHTLSKKAEFERYRLEFNQQFTGVVPSYGSFNDASAPLEDYPDVCRRLTELWPTEEAVEYIEYCLIRSSEIPEGEGLELEAFRDLLMLHGVFRRLESMVDSGMVPFSAPKALMQTMPSNAVGDLVASAPSFVKSDIQPLPTIELPIESEPLDIPLDLDLTEKSDQPDNLIEFDISGYTAAKDVSKPN